MSSIQPLSDNHELPAIDEHLLAGEIPFEIYDGRVVRVAPALEPHGSRHSKVAALLEAHADPAFKVACDLLTRTSEGDNFAPDVSVFPRARHPETGGRQLEHLAFEVAATEALSHAAHKAAKLTARGVRRVFAIDVDRCRMLEWCTITETWSILDSTAVIEDPALAAALPVQAMLDEAMTDDAVADALIARRNRRIEAVRAQDRAEGRAEGHASGVLLGKAELLLTILARSGIAVDAAARERILAERDAARIDRWAVRAATCATTDELFAV